jgi:hypothetical protein
MSDTTLDTEPVPAAEQPGPANPVAGRPTPTPPPAPEIEPARPDGEPSPEPVPRTGDRRDPRAAAGNSTGGTSPAGSEADAAPAEIATTDTGRVRASGKKHDAG